MSEKEFSALCDEQRILKFIYDDVDDSDIFASEPLNTSFTESDPRSETDLPTDPTTALNPEIIQENEILKETVKKLHDEREILQLRISELYKTAKSELERKDRRLKDLEQEKDNIVFRRGNNAFRNTKFDADTRVPVLQQLDKDLTNEEFQNFNTRYRIPKKKNPLVSSDNNETSTENEKPSKRMDEVNLPKEKYKNDDKHWSAYPHLKDKPRRYDREYAVSSKDNGTVNKIREYREDGHVTDKNSKDKLIEHRSRSREKVDLMKQTHTENKTIRSLSDEYKYPSDEGYNKQTRTRYSHSRSKSSTRYKCVSPDNQKQPRTPSKGREERELPNKSRSKSIDEDTKSTDRGIHSDSTSRKTEHMHLARGRSKSLSDQCKFTSNENSSVNKKAAQSRSKSSSRQKCVSPDMQIKQPRSPSREREDGEFPNKSRSESADEDIKYKDRQIDSSSTSRERRHAHSTGRRSGSLSTERKSTSNENNSVNKKSARSRSKSSSRPKCVSSEIQIKQPRSPSREKDGELEDGELPNNTRSKSEDKDIKPKGKRTHSSPVYREKEYLHSSRGKSRPPSNGRNCTSKENNSSNKKSALNRNKSSSMYKPRSPECRTRGPRSPSIEEKQKEYCTNFITSRENEYGHLSRRSRSKSKYRDTKPSRNKSSSRYRCSSSEKQVRPPRTPSKEKDSVIHSPKQSSRSQSRDRGVKPEYSRRRSRSRYRCSSPEKLIRPSRTPSREKDSVIHSPKQSSRSLSRDRDVKPKYSKRRSRSVSQEKKDICQNNRKNRSDSREIYKNERGDSKRKYVERENSERSDLKNDRREDSRGKKKQFDRRDRRERRSRSDSRDRDRRHGFRKNRSTSQERCSRKPPEMDRYGRNKRENRDVRNGERFRRDRSNSNSVERDRREGFRRKDDFPIRRDRNGKIDYKFRRNRTRSRSRERPSNRNITGLQNRSRSSRGRNILELRERLLRYSIDREAQALRNNLKEDKDNHNNNDQKKTLVNNETDHSDIEDLKLYLSGGSDNESLNVENTTDKRFEYSDSRGDVNLELFNDLGSKDIENIPLEQLERLVKERTKLLGGDLDSEDDFNAYFSEPEGRLTDSEYDDPKKTPRRNNDIWLPQNFVEELDYEASPCELTDNQQDQEEDIQYMKSEDNKSTEVNVDPRIVRKNEDRRIENTYEKLSENQNVDFVGEHGKDESSYNYDVPVRESSLKTGGNDKKQFRTVFEARLHERLMNKNRNVKCEVLPNIDKKNTKITRSNVVNVAEERESTFGLRKKTEFHGFQKSKVEVFEKQKGDKAMLNNKSRLNKNDDKVKPKEIKGEECSYDALSKDIQKITQVCSLTRNEISHTLCKVTKCVESDEKYGNKDSDSDLEVVKRKDEDEKKLKMVENSMKEVDIVASKKEKITFSAYKSRRQSIDSKSKEIDVKAASKKSCSETNDLIKDYEKIISTSFDISGQKKLPETEDGVSKSVDSHSVTNVPMQNINELHLVINKESKEPLDMTTDKQPKIDNDLQKRAKNQDPAENIGNSQHCCNETNDGIKTISTKHQVCVTNEDESNRDIEVSANKSQQESNSSREINSFLHDLSISDDEDICGHENLTSDKEEHLMVEQSNRINILSNITIQIPCNSPSNTPPPSKKSSDNVSGNMKSNKDCKDSKSRKTLFKSADFEKIQEAVTNIPGFEKESIDNRDHMRPKNVSQVVEAGSKQTKSPEYPLEKSECIEEIQEAITNMIEDTSVHNSTRNRANANLDKFNTEELQKCLEEDIRKPKIEKVTLSFDSEAKVPRKEVNKIKVASSKRSNEHVDETTKVKRRRQPKQNERAITPPPKEEQVKFNKEDMIMKLFGDITPSPCKPLEEDSGKIKNRDKAKRNIIKNIDGELYSGDSFQVRNKSGDEKVLSKKENNADIQKVKLPVIRNRRSKSVDEKKMQEILQKREISSRLKVEEKSEQLLAQQKAEKKTEMDLPHFCSNPTYIPQLHDKQKLVFESPNHYIHKKNEEVKERKRKLSFDENPLNMQVKAENIKQENINIHTDIKNKIEDKNLDALEKEECIMENSLTTKTEDLVAEGESTEKASNSRQRGRKKTNSKDECAEKQAKKNIQKITAKSTKKKGKSKNSEESEKANLISKQTKKNLTKNNSTEDKKSKTCSFKIKLNNSRKRQKNSGIKENTNKKRKNNCPLPESEKEENSSDSFGDLETCYRKNAKAQAKKIGQKQQKSDEKRCENININNEDDREESLDNSHTQRIKDLVEKEAKIVKFDKKRIKCKPTGKKRKNVEEGEEKCKISKQEKMKEGETFKTQTQNVNNESSETREAAKELSGGSEEIGRKISYKNYANPERESINIEEKSLSNNPWSSTSNILEPVKTIKRITPKRIDDSSFVKKKKQEFKEMKAKRELFINSPSSEITANKRKRLSSSCEEWSSEKIGKMSFTESSKIVEQDTMDNAAHTQITLHETHLDIDVAPNCSPLPRIEQTLDELSKNTALNKNDNAFSNDAQPTDEGYTGYALSVDKNSKNVQLQTADMTFPEINLDTKDVSFLGAVTKDIYLNMTDFSISDKSMISLGGESKTKGGKDSDDSNNAPQSDRNVKDRDLSFTNFLSKNQNTSTPIKNRATAFIKKDAYGPKYSPVNEADSKGVTNVHRNDNPHTCSVITSNLQKYVISNPAVNISSGPVSNVSNDKTSSEMASSVPSTSDSLSKSYVKFSKPLKRDRRRPIRMRVVD